MKIVILINGPMKAGKSTFLNALIGTPLFSSSSYPETYDIFALAYDKNCKIPKLYDADYEKIMTSIDLDNRKCVVVDDKYL